MATRFDVFAPLMRRLPARPHLVGAIFLAGGIALHSVLPHNPRLWLVLLVVMTMAAAVCLERPRWLSVCIAGVVLSAGVLLGQIASFQFPATDIAAFASDDPRLASLELQFDQAPHLVANTGPRRLSGRQTGDAAVVAIKTHSGWQPASGDILFSAAGGSPIAAGQRVRVVGLLQRPSPAMNPGQFDWQKYCRRQRILASIRVNHACDLQVCGNGLAPTVAEARAGVREWLALGFAPSRQVDAALLQAMLLGDRPPEMHEVERNFQKTGASHLLSSSGVRMGVLASLVFLFCRAVCMRPRAAAAAMTLAVVGWGLLTLATPQAMRPVLVAAALGLGLTLRRTIDRYQLLGSAALVLLVIQPLELYSAGFQFSFVIVLGLMLLTRPLLAALGRLDDPHDAALERFKKLTWQKRLSRAIARRLAPLVAASFVAWVVSIPLAAYHFEQFTPWAAPISIALSPIVLLALAGGFFKVAATMLIPPLAPVWAWMAGAPVAVLRWSIAAASHLPGADIPVSPPPVWAIALFYILLCLPLLPLRAPSAPRVRWGFRCGPAGACVVLFLMPWLLGSAGQRTSPDTLRVTLLSVGAGQCAVVEPPARAPLMVDAGSSTLSDPLHLCVEPFLHHEHCMTLSAIYLSHGDFDHINAADGALSECGVGDVITTPFFREHAGESVTCRRLLDDLGRLHYPPREVVAGYEADWGGGVKVKVLWPPKQCAMNSNNAGMVIRLTCAGRSILFPADIQDPAMAELLKDPRQLRADVLIAAHHGSSEPLTRAFVDAVDPKVIISSNAARLTKKQRDFESLIGSRPLYRTNSCGAVTIEIDRQGTLRVTPFLATGHAAFEMTRDGVGHLVEK